MSLLEYVDDHQSVHIDSGPKLKGLLREARKLLSPEGAEKMERELGRALSESVEFNTNEPVNRCLEAWARTIFLKHQGIEDDLVQPIPDDEPASLDEWRARLAG